MPRWTGRRSPAARWCPFILRQGSKNCPDFTQLNKRLCDLYGASLGAGVDKFGEYQIIALGMIGVDSRFTLQGEDMVRALRGAAGRNFAGAQYYRW